jgi:hypothetical protein
MRSALPEPPRTYSNRHAISCQVPSQENPVTRRPGYQTYYSGARQRLANEKLGGMLDARREAR